MSALCPEDMEEYVEEVHLNLLLEFRVGAEESLEGTPDFPSGFL